jgi:hypothetical protein
MYIERGNEMKAARFERVEKGEYQVVDNRNNEVVKRRLANPAKAAAYVEYYDEEVKKAEAEWRL